MNKEMKERLRTAAAYQKKAIEALFPERMQEHMKVIGNEMKAIFTELAAGCVLKEAAKEKEKSAQSKDGAEKRVRKVDIG